jgi:sulfide:quinone oxidoreductase
MAGKTIMVLGGGVGGLTAANALRKRLDPSHRVVLVDKTGEHLFAPSLLWLMVGQRHPARLVRDLRGLVQPGVEVVRAAVREIDPDQGRVRVDGQELGYDALVIALGADLDPEAMPGYQLAAQNFFDLDGAARLWQALRGFGGGRVVVAVSALPYKCPAAPYEAALLLEDALCRRGLRSRSDVVVFTPEPAPMPVAGTDMGKAVVGLLEQRGIVFHPNRPLAAFVSERRELVFKDGARERFDLLAAVPPHKPPEAIRQSSLANEAGWVPVDKHTLRTRFERVYAVGDVASITLANGRPLPKAGVFAHAEALTVAQSVAAELQGGAPAAFDGLGYCWVEMGAGQAGFAVGNFYAEPNPDVRLRTPGRLWHVGKVLFEHAWMGRGADRAVASLGLALGGRALGVPAAV